MGKKDDRFLERLLAAFRAEAEEHLLAIANGLVELEKTSDDSDKQTIIETMYREAHSLKGAARSVSMDQIESVCQAVETIFAGLKNRRLNPSTELFDTLHHSVDTMRELLVGEDSVEVQPVIDHMALLESTNSVNVGKSVEKPGTPPGADQPGELDSENRLIGRLGDDSDQEDACSADDVGDELVAAHNPPDIRDDDRTVVQAEFPEAKESPSASPRKDRPIQTGSTDTVRIAVSKLDPLLRQVGEMVSVKLTASQRLEDLISTVTLIDQWKKKWAGVSSEGRAIAALLAGSSTDRDSVRSDSQLTKLVEFLEWNRSCVKDLETKLKALAKSAESDARLHAQMVDDLLEDMMNVLMLPCASLLELFPKLVRDLAREAEKEINLEIYGGDLEIDRRILDEMKDPLIHLVRNCIDHGIEHPEERLRKGKPRQGVVTIAMSQITGNQIELVVSDDGGGIDVIKVKDAAKRRALISDQDKTRLEGQDALALVFRSEVSTSPIISNISGRGLGLAIVREKVENLGGSITVSTTPQFGASFRILLPVTLATFRGILVHASDRPLIIPTANVERVARIKKNSIKTVGNKDTVEVNGRAVPLVRLADTLELPRIAKKGIEDTEFLQVLILRSGEALVAFSADLILQEQEVLVKSLGKQLSRVRNVAGATVLGSGRLVPILNIPDLIKSALKNAASGNGTAISVEEHETRAKSILVVEDSITSRMLLKNILESSGYQVTTSVDGQDAWNVLKKEQFDLIVSDVEMPRMSGFELTANIRSDEKLSETPVVLVTSLGSREDRERGIEAGANAYIVKGSFDQNHLLEAVQRLV
jgi:two-component system, chemotaxis family, sensor kinase CheA